MKLIRHIPWIVVATLFALVVFVKKAEALTPSPIGWDKVISTAHIIIRVTPGNNGQARYWWWKANIEGTIYCGKYDMSQVLYQPVTGDTWLSAYLSTNMFPAVPMSESDKVWCLQ